MDSLVCARRIQRFGAPPDDDVPERDRVGAAADRSQPRECPTQERPMGFNDAIDQSNVTTSDQSHYHYKAEQCCWPGPEVSKSHALY